MKTATRLLSPLLAAAAVVGVSALLGSGGATVVKIRLIDAATGKPVPAMICIRDAATGDVRLPPDGRIMADFNRVPVYLQGVPYSTDANWAGPVRKMNGVGSNRDRSTVYGELPSVPFLDEPVMMQTTGEFAVQLPEGKWKITAARGMEYVPARVELQTKGGTMETEIRLERWIQLAKEGWYSGDVHVHHPTTEKVHRDYLLSYADAEDVHVVNILEQHHGKDGRHSRQRGFGPKFRSEKNGRWLVGGQEAPSSTFGHIIGLNVERLIVDRSQFDFYDTHFRRIHENPKSLVGYAHFSWNGCQLPRGFPWIVTTEEIDFVELMQFSKVNARDYHDYLNLGFRISAAAGSDVPWGSTMGECRTYVYTGPTLDVDEWFDGLKRGRTFVSNGPALFLDVDGSLPGSVLEKTKGSTVTVRVRGKSHPKIGAITKLRLVSNDGTVRESAGGDLEVKVGLSRSRWFTATAECENEALAHTSPVYVVVDGQPTWCPVRGPGLIDKQLAAMEPIEKEFAGKDDPRSKGIRERLERARAYYAALREAMKR